MLDNLKEIECAYNLLKSGTDSSEDPIDAHYKALNTKLEPVSRDCDDWQYIQKYTSDTHAKTHSTYTLDVEEIFTVKRSGEKSRYSPFRDLPNRMLLWHGSRLTNFAGILSQGLRIAPPEAPVVSFPLELSLLLTAVVGCCSSVLMCCYACRRAICSVRVSTSLTWSVRVPTIATPAS